MMNKKTKKTKNLISIEKQEEARERLKMVYWKSIPLELDRLFKNTQGTKIHKNYFDLHNLKGT